MPNTIKGAANIRNQNNASDVHFKNRNISVNIVRFWLKQMPVHLY